MDNTINQLMVAMIKKEIAELKVRLRVEEKRKANAMIETEKIDEKSKELSNQWNAAADREEKRKIASMRTSLQHERTPHQILINNANTLISDLNYELEIKEMTLSDIMKEMDV